MPLRHSTASCFARSTIRLYMALASCAAGDNGRQDGGGSKDRWVKLFVRSAKDMGGAQAGAAARK